MHCAMTHVELHILAVYPPTTYRKEFRHPVTKPSYNPAHRRTVFFRSCFPKSTPNKTVVTAMTPANDEYMMTR